EGIESPPKIAELEDGFGLGQREEELGRGRRPGRAGVLGDVGQDLFRDQAQLEHGGLRETGGSTKGLESIEHRPALPPRVGAPDRSAQALPPSRAAAGNETIASSDPARPTSPSSLDREEMEAPGREVHVEAGVEHITAVPLAVFTREGFAQLRAAAREIRP